MGLWQWSTTAANNATADPSINWQEGQAPSTVNDSARAMMAALAVQFQNGWEWLQYGDTPTYVSATQFTVPGNLTGRYTQGRRVKASITSGTLYGTIQSSAFGSVTTVTVTWDGGALDSSLSEVDIGILNPAQSSVPTLPGINSSGTVTLTGASTGLEIGSLTASNSPYIDFHSSGNNIDFDARIIAQGGNTSSGNATLNVYASGGLSCSGPVSGSNITGTSDERLKKDWKPFGADFLDRVAGILHGTYTRKDTGERRVGVGAQSLRAILPEAVFGDETLSVAEGSAALAIVIELTREVLRLRELLEPVK